jgi:hypothetical protein
MGSYVNLPQIARAYIRRKLHLPFCLPSDFEIVLHSRGYTALDAVVALADSPAIWASLAIYEIAGRPVVRYTTRYPKPLPANTQSWDVQYGAA